MRAKDTPNFIANRVGIFGMLATIHEAEKFGLSVDVVDDLTGAKLGRAKSGTFRTADVVGLDTMGHVIKTMQDNLPDDPFFAVYKTPDVLAKLVAAGALGQKAGAGFYKKVGKDIQRLDFATGEYVAGGGKAADIVAPHPEGKGPGQEVQGAARIDQSAGAVPVGDLPRRLPLHRRAPGIDRRQRARHRLRHALGLRLERRPVRNLAGRRLDADRQLGQGRHRRRQGAVRTRRCRPGCSKARSPRRACTPPKVRTRRPANSLRAAFDPGGVRAPGRSARRCWAPAPSTARPPAPPCLRRRVGAHLAPGRRGAGHLAQDQDARHRRRRHQRPEARRWPKPKRTSRAW